MANDPVALQMHLMAATDEELQFEDALVGLLLSRAELISIALLIYYSYSVQTRSPAVVVAARLGYTGVLHMLLCKGASAERRDSNVRNSPCILIILHHSSYSMLLTMCVSLPAPVRKHAAAARSHAREPGHSAAAALLEGRHQRQERRKHTLQYFYFHLIRLLPSSYPGCSGGARH
jgi:hypothetical protein